MIGPEVSKSVEFRRGALRIALIYATLGCLWILLSDRVLMSWAGDAAVLTRWQSVKGLLFVFATAGVVGLLVRRHDRRLRDSLRKTAESEQFLRRLVETAGEGIVLIDANESATISFANSRCGQMLGYDAAELAGRSILELMDPPWQEKVRSVRAQGEGSLQLQYDVMLRRKDGGEVWVIASVSRVYDEAGRHIYSLGMLTDVTERRRTERELEQFFTQALDGLCIADLDGRVKELNDALARVLGYNREELLSRDFTQLVHPDDRAAIEQQRQRLARGLPTQFENRCARSDGQYCWLSWSVMPAPDEGLLYATVRDITDRKRAEEAVRRSEATLGSVFAGAPIGIGLARDQVLGLTNAELARMTGYSGAELSGQSMRLFYESEEEFQRVERARADRTRRGGEQDVETRWRRKDGTIFDVLVRSTPLEPGDPASGVVFTAQDVTERKRLETQLRQVQKMEAVGQLADGVAHDFSNSLTAILGHAELMRDALNKPPPDSQQLAEGLTHIERAGQRAVVLTRQLLAFGQNPVTKPEILDPAGVLLGLEAMLRRLLPEDVDLRISCAPHLWRVRGDVGQLEQIVMNLAVNARDAMPQGGVLSIEAANVPLGPDAAQQHPGAHPGPHVMLAVRDTGRGMDAETLQHVLEPFFTTKPGRRGSGLGLASVQNLVKRFGGHTEIESRSGDGSVFRVYLPAASTAPMPAASAVPADTAANGETVLLCEDDAQVREITWRMLATAGYNVLLAALPEEALEIASRHTGPIDLLLTDVVMPGMNGRELAQRLQVHHPDMGVLYVSGYAADVIADRGLLRDDIELLEKPFSSTTLLRRVRRVLNRSSVVAT